MKEIQTLFYTFEHLPTSETGKERGGTILIILSEVFRILDPVVSSQSIHLFSVPGKEHEQHIYKLLQMFFPQQTFIHVE